MNMDEKSGKQTGGRQVPLEPEDQVWREDCEVIVAHVDLEVPLLGIVTCALACV